MCTVFDSRTDYRTLLLLLWANGVRAGAGRNEVCENRFDVRFLRSMVSARDIEHMSTGSGHAYNDYRSYGAGPVANLSQTEPMH